MADLNEILKDSTKYPDNLTIKIQDTDVPLGSLRQLHASERQSIERERSEIGTARQTLEQERSQVIELARKAAEASATIDGVVKQRESSADPYENDILYEPVRKRLSKHEETVGSLKTEIDKLQKTFQNGALLLAEERWQRQWDKIEPELEKYPELKSNWDYDKVLKFAAENKHLDSRGFPDIRKAWHVLTEAAREKQKADEAYQRGIEEGKKMAMLKQVPRPTSAGKGGPPVQTTSDGLDGLTKEAYDDPEIRGMIEQLQSEAIQ